MRLRCPNVPGARLPMYEQFADDCYELRWVLGPGTGPVRVLDVGAHVGAFAINARRRPAGRPGRVLRAVARAPRGTCGATSTRTAWTTGCGCTSAALAGEAGTARCWTTTAAAACTTAWSARGPRLVDGDDSGRQPARRPRQDRHLRRRGRRGRRAVRRGQDGLRGRRVRAGLRLDKQNWASVQRVVLEYHPVDGESWDELRTWFESVGLQGRAARDRTAAGARDSASPGWNGPPV